MTVLIFGLGFIGRAVARRLRVRGLPVLATVREETVPLEHGVIAAPLNQLDTRSTSGPILITAPPSERGCPGLAALGPSLAAGRGPIAYLSTTGVYGDYGGRWVFEESDLRPQSPEALRRVQAEDAWREAARLAHRDLHIVRLPGLYGPGRSAFDRLRAGDARRIVRPGQVFSRLHADDAATALETLLTGGRPGDIWNLCDDEPAPNPDVITYAAGLLGVPPPPEELYDPQSAPPARRRFYAESKRVSNARAKAALGWRPQFRTYREGLAAILAAEGAA